MCRYDTDVSGRNLHDLDLASRSSGKGDELAGHAAQAKKVVCRLEAHEQVRSSGEGVDSDAVLENDDDAVSCKSYASHGGQSCYLETRLGLGLVPKNDLDVH